MPRWITNVGYWLAYQAKVWRWGAFAFVMLAVSALIPATLAAGAFAVLDMLTGGASGIWTYGLLVVLCAPFGLYAYESTMADWRRSRPSPREIDLWRQQNGLPPRA